MYFLRVFFVVLWMFVTFGIGFVASLVRWGDHSLNHFVAGFFGRGGLKICGIRVIKEGVETLENRQPCIYVANHQGALDILTFGSIFPKNTVVIGKKEVGWIPILNLYYISAGNILIDRKKRTSAFASIGKAVQAVKEKKASVWIFPEGTRNRFRDQQIMLPLKKGAFFLAIEAQVPLVPVVSGPIDHVIDSKTKMLRPGTVRLKVLPPIETTGLKASDVDQLAMRTHALMVEAIRGLQT